MILGLTKLPRNAFVKYKVHKRVVKYEGCGIEKCAEPLEISATCSILIVFLKVVDNRDIYNAEKLLLMTVVELLFMEYLSEIEKLHNFIL